VASNPVQQSATAPVSSQPSSQQAPAPAVAEASAASSSSVSMVNEVATPQFTNIFQGLLEVDPVLSALFDLGGNEVSLGGGYILGSYNIHHYTEEQ
jgi:hypothetical protein